MVHPEYDMLDILRFLIELVVGIDYGLGEYADLLHDHPKRLARMLRAARLSLESQR